MTTYRGAGVDVGAGERLIASISDHVQATWGPSVTGPFGSFAAGVRLPPAIESPVLMMTTDGVGTKLDLARSVGIIDGLGSDLVAMSVDDLAAMGASPIGFCDYLAVGQLHTERDRLLIGSIAEACRRADCPLLGGETAEHPGVLRPDQFDLVGAALGVVSEGSQVTGSAIRSGDVIIGLSSPNLRSNGFSLVRSVIEGLNLDEPLPGTTEPAAQVLCEPSVIYAPTVLKLLESVEVHGLAHITGGGLVRNLRRILPDGYRAIVDSDSWEVPRVFEAIRQLGSVTDDEMMSTFNMGVGFCIVLADKGVDEALAALREHEPSVIGRVEPGPASVEFA
ncbi:MAG: phosphoribosylformylglycinamidine cyclo-ligase [Acidimicrobiia bacterium]